MALTDEQKEKIVEIDRCVKLTLLKKGSDTMLIMGMPDILGKDFDKILAAAEEGELDLYCKKYSGFYKMMKILNTLATEISDKRNTMFMCVSIIQYCA